MGPTGLREISSLAVGVGATYGLGVGAGGMYTVSPVSLPETLLAVVDGAAVDVGVVVVGFGLLITASGSSVTGISIASGSCANEPSLEQPYLYRACL